MAVFACNGDFFFFPCQFGSKEGGLIRIPFVRKGMNTTKLLQTIICFQHRILLLVNLFLAF